MRDGLAVTEMASSGILPAAGARALVRWQIHAYTCLDAQSSPEDVWA
jgi:hypothetical protein